MSIDRTIERASQIRISWKRTDYRCIYNIQPLQRTISRGFSKCEILTEPIRAKLEHTNACCFISARRFSGYVTRSASFLFRFVAAIIASRMSSFLLAQNRVSLENFSFATPCELGCRSVLSASLALLSRFSRSALAPHREFLGSLLSLLFFSASR